MSSFVRSLLSGVFFGAALVGIGFASWDEVHAMFTFSDLRLVLTFGCAVAILVPVNRLLARAGVPQTPPRSMNKGVVPGALLFGAGWAISGACPGITLVQLGEGQLGAVATILGIVAGNLAFRELNGRVFHVPTSSCADG